jgi:hypothetical protein
MPPVESPVAVDVPTAPVPTAELVGIVNPPPKLIPAPDAPGPSAIAVTVALAVPGSDTDIRLEPPRMAAAATDAPGNRFAASSAPWTSPPAPAARTCPKLTRAGVGVGRAVLSTKTMSGRDALEIRESIGTSS